MAEIEIGHKWWIRYVVVPLIVAVVGGVVGLVILLNHSTDSVFKVPAPTDSQNDEKTETVEVNASATDVIALDELYIVDEHDAALVKDVRVRKGSVFTVKWDARDSSSGQLHLLLLGGNGHTIMDKKIGEMGLQRVSSDYPIGLKLVEEYGGKRHLIKALPVKVF